MLKSWFEIQITFLFIKYFVEKTINFQHKFRPKCILNYEISTVQTQFVPFLYITA